jgi:Nif-specific regulatory protein
VGSEGDELVRTRRERDLYRRLLDLGRSDELAPFLRDALGLVVEVTGAGQGYLQLHHDDDGDTPRWWIAHGLTAAEVEGVRGAISRSIIAEALATAQTVTTLAALDDPKFGATESVRIGHIGAVLCVPIGEAPPRGVLYLQNREPGRVFTADDRACAETFAHHLAPLVDRVLARDAQRRQEDATAPVRRRLRLDGVVGRSPALAAALEQVALVAPLDVHVLLTGDSGTGKSQLARLIHDNGPRAARPFVDLNCAALPETLLESELFGALPGAHSTATRRIEGKVAAAEGGTLFLDEVGELAPGAQAKLLQLLQSKEYYPLGGTRPVRADVRVIAATNTDLERAVAERRFREDLFYRLQVLPIRVPSLAERPEDVGPLAAFFCTRACDRHGFRRLELSPNARHAAESTEWPGNVRQLEHAIEAAVIRAAGAHATRIEVAHLFPGTPAVPEPDASPTFQELTRRYQARVLREMLEAQGWNVVETARRLDLARSHVYKLIRAFGLARDRR